MLYLDHTSKKIRSFEPDKPYNDLPLLPPNFDFDDIQIVKKVNKANIALSRLSGEAKSIPNREVLIEPLTFREAVASSEIENIHKTSTKHSKKFILLKKNKRKNRKRQSFIEKHYLRVIVKLKNVDFSIQILLLTFNLILLLINLVSEEFLALKFKTIPLKK